MGAVQTSAGDVPGQDGPRLTLRSRLRCVSCSQLVSDKAVYRCPACGGVLEVAVEVTQEHWDAVERLVTGTSQWAYRSRLPVDVEDPVTLGEGSTPLLEAAPDLAGPGFTGRVLLKDETGNPTGSFKDRLVSVAVTRAIQDGHTGIVCASTGNAGASAAAYSARAGLPCVVCIPASAPDAKLRQIQAYGPQFIAVDGTYSDAWTLADELQRAADFANVTTTYQNPYGVSALRTVAYELLDAMDGEVPDAVFVPTGSGPLVRGVMWGYEEALDLGLIGHIPRLVAVQAEGCAPIVRAFDQGNEHVTPWDDPSTIATGIADPLQGYAQDGTYTLTMVRKSNGWAIAVTDDEIRAAADDLSEQTGVFAELTGAAGLAGLRASVRHGWLQPEATAVVMVTGSGFKDLQNRTERAVDRIAFDPAKDSVESVVEQLQLDGSGGMRKP